MIAIVVSELYGKTQQIHFFNKESVVVVLVVCLRVTFTQNKKKMYTGDNEKPFIVC